MIRLNFIVEGQTEEKFVNTVIAPHLGAFNISCAARCVLTSKDKRTSKQFKGGIQAYQKAKNDIERWLNEDKNNDCRFTTMFDFYALPTDFPNYAECKKIAKVEDQICALEKALKNDINDYRFIPYLQLHEFEALVFADPQKLDLEYFNYDRQIKKLVDVASKIDPEHINDGVDTAPSKRILKAIPEYDKINAGVIVVEQIGLDTLRAKCPHFNEWLTKLENLATEDSQ